MNPKNIRLYVRNKWYFIVGHYQKDMCFYEKDAYFYYDIDVDKISLLKQSKNKSFIRYYDVNKIESVPPQLKINNFYYETHDNAGYNEKIYIEGSDKEFFEKIRKIWNKIIEVLDINNGPNFVKTNVIDDEECIKANILGNTNCVKSNCYKDELIIVLHSVINNNLKASLLEATKHNINYVNKNSIKIHNHKQKQNNYFNAIKA